MLTVNDDAVEEALSGSLKATGCERVWPDDWPEEERTVIRTGMRSALLAALPHMAGWRQIADAPKDGRTILVARHMDNFGWVLGTSYWEDIRGISGWISRGVGVFGELGLGHPTHWLPFPPAPGSTTPLPLTEAQIRADERDVLLARIDEIAQTFRTAGGKNYGAAAQALEAFATGYRTSVATAIRESVPSTAGSAE